MEKTLEKFLTECIVNGFVSEQYFYFVLHVLNPSDDELAEIFETLNNNNVQIIDDSSVVNDGVSAYLRDISRFKLLSSEEIRELSLKKNCDARAKEKLITSNLRFVTYVAKKYIGRGVDYLDLIQEGNIALMKAIDKYDYTKGRITTFAVRPIINAINDCINRNAKPVKIPSSFNANMNKVLSAMDKLISDGISADYTNIAALTGLSKKQVRNVILSMNTFLSFDSPVGEDEDATVGDLIPCSCNDETDTVVYKQLLSEHVCEKLKLLSKKEVEIIYKRYGFDGPEMTCQEVADSYGNSRQNISKIERKALDKLRNTDLMSYR